MYTNTKTCTLLTFLYLLFVTIFAIVPSLQVQAQVSQLSTTATPASVKPGGIVTITVTTNTTYDTSAYNLSVVVTYQGKLIKGPLTAISVTPKSSTYQWIPASTDAIGIYAVVGTLTPVPTLPWVTSSNTANLTAQASVSLSDLVLNGACGSANGLVTAKAPTTNLCSAGVASKVTAYTGFAAEGVWAWACAGSNGGSTASCAGTNSLPKRSAQFTLDFSNDNALTAFLQSSKQPNINYVIPTDYRDKGAALKAKGYKVQEALTGAAAQEVQGYLIGQGALPGVADHMYAIIDKYVASGVTMIWVDEIWPAPGETDCFSQTSLSYNVKGINMLYDYIHSKYPGVIFGLSMGDTQGIALHMAMLKAGLKEDFAQLETYNVDLSGPKSIPVQRAYGSVPERQDGGIGLQYDHPLQRLWQKLARSHSTRLYLFL